MARQGSTGNVIAALCSVFVPGLGQLIQGNIFMAIVTFVIVTVGYALWFLVIPAIFAAIVHLWAIYQAATFEPYDFQRYPNR